MLRSENRSRKESREALIASLPVDENGDVPEDFLRRRNNLRSVRSRAADGRSTAKRVYPRAMPPEQAAAWVMNPGRYDVEGIDCDGKANVKRREPKAAKAKTTKGKSAKPKAPAEKPVEPKTKAPAGKTAKPKTPKAKAPAKPKEPEKPAAPKKPKTPAKNSGVVVSGSEIVDVAKFIDGANCTPLALGNDQYSMEYATSYFYSDYGVALSRKDGKGLYGLDNDKVWGLCACGLYNLYRLDRDAVYEISLEGKNLVLRTGPDFSVVAQEVSTRRDERPMTFKWMTNGFMPPDMFDVDVAALKRALGKLERANVVYCRLETTEEGVVMTPSRGKSDFRAVIAPPTGGKRKWSDYGVHQLNSLVKALAPYVHSMGFCPDGPLVLKGEFCGYEMTAVLKGSWLQLFGSRDIRPNGSKPVIGRRSQR